MANKSKKYDAVLVKHIRDKKNWSQKRMAEELGVDQATVSKIENGRMVPSKTISILLAYVAAT